MDVLYVGNDRQAGELGTGALLRWGWGIWAPPPGLMPWLWPVRPLPGLRVWLAWMAHGGGQLILLGGGRLCRAPRDPYGETISWTNVDCPGIRAAASLYGYGGGPAASFVRLSNAVAPSRRTIIPISATSGWNVLGPRDLALLMQNLRVR